MLTTTLLCPFWLPDMRFCMQSVRWLKMSWLAQSLVLLDVQPDLVIQALYNAMQAQSQIDGEVHLLSVPTP